MMYKIPNSKTGDCSQCERKNVSCRKVAKHMWCLDICYKNKKQQEALIKQADNKNKTPVKIISKNIPVKVSGGGELQRWFQDRREEMGGVCKHCGGQTEAGKVTYQCSVCHILPKAYFKSIATHPLNFIELCFYGNSCHTNFDNSMIDLMDLNCFDEIIRRFVIMYPFIDKKERRRIPDVLLQYVKIDSGVDEGWDNMEKILDKECSQDSGTEKVL